MDRNERRLKQYQDAIDASNIVSKTDVKGYITFVNDEFCNISKYSKEELIGSNHNIVRHPDVNPKVFRCMWNTILSKKVYKGIIKNLAKDGSVFYLNATIIPILDEDGEIEEFVAIRHNVTEVVVLNERLLAARNELKELNLSLEEKVLDQTKELIELNKSLEERIALEVNKNEEKNKLLFQQSRLASMGEMIGNIAHQWRQPLSELGIDLFKMKQQIDDKESFVAIYEHAKIVIKNMSKTIDDFRNFFKSDKEKELFFISEAVNDAFTMLRGTFKKESINFDLVNKKDVEISGFKSELSQVFMNLFTNAKDAMKETPIKDKKLVVSIQKSTNYVIVSIFNSGKQIEKENLDKIFEPYFTTKHPSSGTGLGLYINKMILERMGGDIDVKNLKNGVSFSIKLPICKEV
ncbi:PAS domain-containing sensor histidine kinase [Campylobacter geochelonis]|uniref:histidine kinase n=1 Tax=Campylobacter geochelonis TaxID=1780362 RepID=A0A128EFR8_9BACT|nr:PAS domain-containing sensor histidine kinase [Campylobacter geochelonis]QKF71984.1 PAS sensor-containing two-component system histidine kinase [Campylobacter geochelonis]CZE47744.1 PAS/PAC sensor signal transduction histidine kinase [Campylobacter geochelonis]CZE48972.1 PAS/PAC sensor signal transduction histidine kinase [Campylobacter geochelonis]CZE49932.1 PAS/PAC sensor signal transduction histidine kinase [Campylobacter geochelonis]